MNGLLVLDKPLGITSRDALDRALKWFPRRTRMGHTGTLDPLATGILVACIGWTTRLADYVQAMPKEYVAGVRFGSRSATDDAEGPIEPVANAWMPDEGMLRTALASFVGEIPQTPPAFSAAKVVGRRAYSLARRGQDVQLEPRVVRIYAIELRRFDGISAELHVRCGKGTYIRSLARDLGEKLGCGAYLEALQRTRVGPFDEPRALSLDAPAEVAMRSLLPPAEALADLQRRMLPGEMMQRFFSGQAMPWDDDDELLSGEIALTDDAGRLRAIGEYEAATRQMKPAKVLAKTEADV
ncbi:MAG: tRNA pseudouridine(55) synthase TruB [Gemmataceae bacterium]|nr:tRNA pseudouridine(55) synthase TruB [Gemmataceae bacterium]